MASHRPTLIAQLTDTHVVRAGGTEELWVDNRGRLREAVAAIEQESPPVEAVLATGDLTYDGRPGEYEELVAALAPLRARVLPLPGNHDDPDALRAAFPEVPWADAAHASWVTEVGPVRLVGLDSTRPGEPGGEHDAAREEWLRTRLAVPHEGPTILALHHPPFATGIGWMDDAGFAGLDRLRATLGDHPVDRVVCGHLHRPITSAVAGIPAQVGVSTVESVVLDLSAESTPAVIRDPAGYMIHRVEGRDIVTHTRYIATGERPLAPRWVPAAG